MPELKTPARGIDPPDPAEGPAISDAEVLHHQGRVDSDRVKAGEIDTENQDKKKHDYQMTAVDSPTLAMLWRPSSLPFSRSRTEKVVNGSSKTDSFLIIIWVAFKYYVSMFY